MKLAALLPFMDQGEIDGLADKIVAGEVENVELAIVYPFIGREKLESLVDLMIDNKTFRHVYSALPFLSRERVGELYQRVQKEKIEGFQEDALLPFLGKDKIKDIFNQMMAGSTRGESETDEKDDSTDE
jgi:hypothetical protein